MFLGHPRQAIGYEIRLFENNYKTVLWVISWREFSERFLDVDVILLSGQRFFLKASSREYGLFKENKMVLCTTSWHEFSDRFLDVDTQQFLAEASNRERGP